MSEFLKHEPCPSCGSRDNLGVWDDGHKYCFGCKWTSFPEGTEWVKAKLKDHTKQSVSSALPGDCSVIIPSFIREKLLTQYRISYNEIRDHGFLWSEEKQLFIYPVRDLKNDVVFWNGRYYGPNKEHPKYITRGRKDGGFIHVVGSTDGGGNLDRGQLCIVEDILSGIRVSRYVDCYVLFGSSFSNQVMARIAKKYSEIHFWLDPDMRKTAIGMRNSAKQMFDKAWCVFSQRDPKELDDAAIKWHLGIERKI